MRWQLSFILLGATLLVAGCASSKAANPGPPRVQDVRLFAREGKLEPEQIQLKALRPVKLKITSFDTDYYFHIPSLGVSATLIPALGTAEIPLTPVRTGPHEILTVVKSSVKGVIFVEVCPPEAEGVKNPVASSASSVAVGKALYDQRCASCHGTGGRGDGAAAQSLRTKPIDFTARYMKSIRDGEFFWVIGEGYQEMPAFKTVLTEEERWHTVNYLRSLSSE